jgi:hypothetical protein
LYENFFVKPSTLQEALACPPERRRPAHIDTIITALRLIPFLQKISEYNIAEMAQCIGK